MSPFQVTQFLSEFLLNLSLRLKMFLAWILLLSLLTIQKDNYKSAQISALLIPEKSRNVNTLSIVRAAQSPQPPNPKLKQLSLLGLGSKGSLKQQQNSSSEHSPQPNTGPSQVIEPGSGLAKTRMVKATRSSVRRMDVTRKGNITAVW